MEMEAPFDGLLAIVNARPLVSVSNDPDAPDVLTPATLLTHKPQHLKPPAGEFSAANLSHKQWKRVQHLADVSWSRWRREYLLTLKPRRKWQNTTCNVQKGDLVILRCKGMTGLSPESPELKPTVTEWCAGWT